MASRLEADGNLKDAEMYYRLAVSAQPPKTQIQILADNNLAMMLARAKRGSDAKPFIDSAIKLLPETPELYDTRAFVQSTTGGTDPAISDILHAIRLDPAEPRFGCG